MISFKSVYEVGKKPVLIKTLTVGDQSAEIKLSPQSDKEELDAIPLSVLYEHLDNYVLYLKDWINNLETYRLSEPNLDGRFAFRGYDEVDLVMYESSEWWKYMYTSRESEEETPA